MKTDRETLDAGCLNAEVSADFSRPVFGKYTKNLREEES